MTLQAFFKENPRVALGFSGGVDSSYLLYAAKKYGATVGAYFIKTAFQPAFELADALRLAERLGVEVQVIEADILAKAEVVENPANRCYHCKTALFSLLKNRALQDGYTLLLDGTNASDQVTDRPGMQALSELGVRSPLRECGLTKPQIRMLSKAGGLFTWDKPAYACLATRIPTGRPLTAALLSRVEQAEDALFALGFSDFRVRVYGDAARLQFPETQMKELLEKREAVRTALQAQFTTVLLDLEER